jgi:hypothetical protein
MGWRRRSSAFGVRDESPAPERIPVHPCTPWRLRMELDIRLVPKTVSVKPRGPFGQPRTGFGFLLPGKLLGQSVGASGRRPRKAHSRSSGLRMPAKEGRGTAAARRKENPCFPPDRIPHFHRARPSRSRPQDVAIWRILLIPSPQDGKTAHMEIRRITGTVRSGGAPDALPLGRMVTVAVYEATEGVPRRIGTAVTDAEGRFSVEEHAGPDPEGILYAAAHVHPGVVLLAVIGAEVPGPITINELSTVAAAFSMAQFARESAIAGRAFGLRVAAGMSGNLVAPLTGDASEVMLTSPNADETTSLRSMRALANLVAACVRQRPGALEALRRLAPGEHGEPPADTFQAMVNIARNPARNVGDLYRQTKAFEVYVPALERLRPPDAWTLAVKVNDSGSERHMFGGPANVAFDANGYAWVANNVVQGTPASAKCIMVLRPDGRPADGRNGTPRSPVSGGGILGVGLGVTVAPNGHAWVGNFGWGDPDTEYPVDGTVSEIDAHGHPVSPPAGYGGGTYRVQGTVADRHGNLWLASFGNDRVVVFPGGRPHEAFGYPATGSRHQKAPGVGPFCIAPTEDGAWVTYSGGLGWPENDQSQSCVCRYRLREGELELVHTLPVGWVTKGIALDSEGNAWVASGGDDRVYMISPDGATCTGFSGGGISGPWNVAVDGDDQVWVANFGPMGPTHDYTTASVSRLAGIRPPRGLKTGDPLSPGTGYTLHSAGSPVLLANGDPLYGPGAEPSYTPLMRQTSCAIDQAGNVWAVNNWKPDFGTDFLPKTGNPGGDGIVIFVGLAKPPAPPF